MKKLACSLILFLFGGTGYAMLELLWRGFTHWSMFVLGGVCYLLVGRVAVWCCIGFSALWFLLSVPVSGLSLAMLKSLQKRMVFAKTEG